MSSIKNYRDIGRLAGEQIATAKADTPSQFEKAVEVAIGAIAVLETHGVRVTAPLLLKNPAISEALEAEGIGEATFRAALTEARKRWVAETIAEKEPAKPKRRRATSRSSSQKDLDGQDSLAANTALATGDTSKRQEPADSHAPPIAPPVADQLSLTPFVHDVAVENL